jgi:hypothetical protein
MNGRRNVELVRNENKFCLSAWKNIALLTTRPDERDTERQATQQRRKQVTTVRRAACQLQGKVSTLVAAKTQQS